jgi:mRNA-degrading endonuclease YafQ of YafQ-DinJ toxin-antitoxin module
MNSRNADSNAIMIDVEISQKSNIAKLKSLHNDKKKIKNIIELLTKTFMLEKEKNKDHS